MRILPQRKSRFQRGSVIVTCMVLAALGTIGVAAWISLLDARGHQVEQNLTALKRRAVEKNSRALTRLALHENHLHDDEGLAADTTYEIPGGLGTTVIKAYSGAPLSNQGALRYSKNGAVPLRAYTTDIAVDISDGIGTQTWQFQLKNYNPILAGDLLVMNPPVNPNDPTPLVSGNLNVKGRAVFWDAVARDYTAGLRADEIIIPSGGGTATFLDTNGAAVAPLNYPIPRQTAGFAGAANPNFGGLDIINSATNFHNAYVSRIQSLGPFDQIDGDAAYAVGPGPDTAVDNPNDDTLEPEVQTQTTAYLVTELPNHYPLSSRILRAVAAKTAPSAFTEDEIYDIFAAHIPVPNDALTSLTGPFRNRLGTRTDEFHWANGTTFSSDGSGTVRVFLEKADLPHLIVESASEIKIFGQRNSVDASAAAALDPRAIVVPNSGGNHTSEVVFDGQNSRRMVFALATESTASNFVTDFNFTGSLAFPTWSMILDLQNTSALIDASAIAGVNMIGGIRANRPIAVTGGTVTLRREYEHEGLETLLSRNAWVESYKQ